MALSLEQCCYGLNDAPTGAGVPTSASGAYAAGKVVAEQRIQEATGIPIRLPAKLDAKSLAQSVGALLPTDVQGVINTALSIGAQGAASALTSVLAGAGIGSVVPGLGTIVGIGAALGAAALQGAIKNLIKPRGRKCITPWRCPQVPANVSPIELLPWMVPHYVAVTRAIAAENGFKPSEPCVRGATMECYWAFRTLALKAFELGIAKTPQAMGATQVIKLIPQYEQGLAQMAAIGEPNGFRTGGSDTMRLVLQRLQARKRQLDQLAGEYAQAMRPGAPRSLLVALRPKLSRELANAALQVQIAPGADTQQWFAFVANAMTSLVRADEAAQRAMHEKLARQRAQGEERLRTDAAARAAHEEQIRAAQRSESQAGRTPAPSPQAARDYCARIFTAWRNDPKNAAQARCLTPSDIDQISKICFQAHGTRAISPGTALQMIGRQIQAACARQARSGSAALRGLADVRPTVLIEESGRLVPKPVRPYSQPAVVLRAGTRAAEIARLMQ